MHLGGDIGMDKLKGKKIMVWTFMGNTRIYKVLRIISKLKRRPRIGIAVFV